VELKCLDERYYGFKFGVRPGFSLTKLEPYIRHRYEEKGRPISQLAQFRFYSEGKELDTQHEIKEGAPTIWYRMSKSFGGSGEEDAWKFTYWQDETNMGIEPFLADDLIRAIEEGATIGQLRRRIANFIGIDDPNRIVLIARGGTRAGLLQGNCWEARQLKKWLCRWISFDINPSDCYVVLRGLGREYVYHPLLSYFREGMDLRAIKSYLETRLFRAVRQHGRSDFNIAYTEVVLSRSGDGSGGKPLPDHRPVRWAQTYEFELPDDAAEIFSNEETWLLPLTESCSICIEDKRISEMPTKITANCAHPPSTCKDCLKQWLASSLESGSWDRLKCPDCSELLEFLDVKRNASPETFARYDTLATRAVLKDIPNFRWCLSTSCESGQIHDETCAKFKCVGCQARHCIVHNVPWHKGETCDEYSRRNRQRKKEDKASETIIKKTSKKCPECQRDVHKWTGCNHITCVCTHEWCYICLAPFRRNQHGFLYCRHNEGCTEPHDPIVDIIDPPAGPNHLRRAQGRGARAVPPPPPQHPGNLPNLGGPPPPPGPRRPQTVPPGGGADRVLFPQPRTHPVFGLAHHNNNTQPQNTRRPVPFLPGGGGDGGGAAVPNWRFPQQREPFFALPPPPDFGAPTPRLQNMRNQRGSTMRQRGTAEPRIPTTMMDGLHL